MIIISTRYNDVKKILGNQDFIVSTLYRPILYHKAVFVNDGVLVYNLITRELVLMSIGEYSNYNNGIATEYLVNHWFMVPHDLDDSTLLYIYNKSFDERFKINEYGKFNLCTIITTTDCNARCPYCYEKGIQKKHMTEKVALDVAKYILERCQDGVRLNWFGGEPLYNYKIINLICDYFIENNVNFSSSMISNGYLFDQIPIDIIKNRWNLKTVQITLDGTKEIYNKTKDYIYKNVNAFDKIIKNIGFLLSNEIFINIRLNISNDNINNLYKLCDFLALHFSGNPYINVYCKVLFDAPTFHLSSNERHNLFLKQLDLSEYIRSKKLCRKFSIPPIKRCHCMANDGRSAVFNTDGNLSLCEHYITDGFYGSIYSNEYDRDILRKFKERSEPIEECKTCFYRPQCIKLKACDPEKICDNDNRMEINWQVTTMMKDVYDKYKRNLNTKCN